MAAPATPRVKFATDIFIREMRRQWLQQHPSADPMSCPVKAIESYHPQQRAALNASIEKAIEASTGMTDAYSAWLKSKVEAGQPA